MNTGDFHAKGPRFRVADGGCGDSRRDEGHSGELRGVAARVAGEDGATQNCCVRANEKIGEYIRLGSAFAAILNVRLAREKRSGTRNVKNIDFHCFEPSIDFSLAGKRDGDLRVDDGIDCQLMQLRLDV